MINIGIANIIKTCDIWQIISETVNEIYLLLKWILNY